MVYKNWRFNMVDKEEIILEGKILILPENSFESGQLLAEKADYVIVPIGAKIKTDKTIQALLDENSDLRKKLMRCLR